MRRVTESFVLLKSMRGSWKGIAPLYPMTRARECVAPLGWTNPFKRRIQLDGTHLLGEVRRTTDKTHSLASLPRRWPGRCSKRNFPGRQFLSVRRGCRARSDAERQRQRHRGHGETREQILLEPGKRIARELVLVETREGTSRHGFSPRIILQRLMLPQSVLWLCRAVFYHKKICRQINLIDQVKVLLKDKDKSST